MKKLFACILFLTLLVPVFLFSAAEGDQTGTIDYDGYPEKPIIIVIPASPGGGTDGSARIVAKYMSEQLGKNVSVVNMAGAGGTVAVDYVKNSPPDGYVAYYSTGFILPNHLTGVSKYSWEDAFEIIGVTGKINNAIIVGRQDLPINNFVDLKQKKDLNLIYAVEAGTVAQSLAMAINKELDVNMNIVDFGSAANRLTAVLGGHADLGYVTYALAKDYINTGKLKVLAGVSDNRPDGLPDVQTLIEQGVDVSYNVFHFIAFPKGTPSEIVNKFSDGLEQIMSQRIMVQNPEIFD
jgi:tripartite-type tricarboxylate transporter receptor subunit TctC